MAATKRLVRKSRGCCETVAFSKAVSEAQHRSRVQGLLQCMSKCEGAIVQLELNLKEAHFRMNITLSGSARAIVGRKPHHCLV